MGMKLMFDVLTSLKDVKALENGQKIDAPTLLLLLVLAHENFDQYKGEDGWWGTEEKLANWVKVCERKLGNIKKVLVGNGLLKYETKPCPCINHKTGMNERRKNVYKVDYAKIRLMNPVPDTAPHAEEDRTTCGASPHHVRSKTAPRADNTINNKESNNNNNRKNAVAVAPDVVAHTLQMLIASELGVAPSSLGINSIRDKIVGKDIAEVRKIVLETAQSRRNNPQKVRKDANFAIPLMFARCEALPPATVPSATDPAQWVKPAPEPAAEPPRNPVDDLWAKLVSYCPLDEKVSTAIKGEFYELFEALSERRRPLLFGRLKDEIEAFPRDNLVEAFHNSFKKIREIANLD